MDSNDNKCESIAGYPKSDEWSAVRIFVVGAIGICIFVAGAIGVFTFLLDSPAELAEAKRARAAQENAAGHAKTHESSKKLTPSKLAGE